VGVPDGVAGARTLAAVREYQRREGLAPSGEIDEILIARLEAARAKAASAPAVKTAAVPVSETPPAAAVARPPPAPAPEASPPLAALQNPAAQAPPIEERALGRLPSRSVLR
jgi:peptidoglycan hydrolase-like protein with peptidoglycan-binding domain